MTKEIQLLKELVELEIRLSESCVGYNGPPFKQDLATQINYIRTILTEDLEEARK